MYYYDGILLNTNTIDNFKSIDKKKVIESLAQKVFIMFTRTFSCFIILRYGSIFAMDLLLKIQHY